MGMIDRAQLTGEAHGIGRVGLAALDEEGLDADPDAELRRMVAHLAKTVPLDRVQPVDLARCTHPDQARMLDHERAAHRRRELEACAADGLVMLQIRLVHEVHGEGTVRRVAEIAAGAAGLQATTHLGNDTAARDEVGIAQRELDVGGAGLLDATERPVQAREVGPVADRAESEAGNPLHAHQRTPIG